MTTKWESLQFEPDVGGRSKWSLLASLNRQLDILDCDCWLVDDDFIKGIRLTRNWTKSISSCIVSSRASGVDSGRCGATGRLILATPSKTSPSCSTLPHRASHDSTSCRAKDFNMKTWSSSALLLCLWTDIILSICVDASLNLIRLYTLL